MFSSDFYKICKLRAFDSQPFFIAQTMTNKDTLTNGNVSIINIIY